MANDLQCSWCGVVGGHDPRCYVGRALRETPPPDFREGFDKATRAWAHREIARNATMGPYERRSSDILNEVNIIRHAYGLAILKYDDKSDTFHEHYEH